jgi:hypothetical protein
LLHSMDDLWLLAWLALTCGSQGVAE